MVKAYRQMLPSVTVYRASQSWGRGRPEGWEGRGSGSHLSPATSFWSGDLLQRPSLIWTSVSSSSAVTRLEQLSLRSFPAFCNLFWNLMSILKGGRKVQRKAGKGEREGERNSIIICYGTLGKELSPVWTSISFPLKWGSFIFNIPFNSRRLYKSINWIFCPWVLISMGKRPWVKSLPWMDPDCLHFSITPFNCEHLHQLIFRTGRGRNTTL